MPRVACTEPRSPVDSSGVISSGCALGNFSARGSAGGSACSSGASVGSHVIHALQKDENCTTIRFSFSKYNTKEEVDEFEKGVEKAIKMLR